ncbi:MAG: ABC transporter ATP-binding protein/permease [Bifidobacterium sp.]|nr:ABC transporter ATP-binding protein/permease [Bifidobacterium sp.]
MGRLVAHNLRGNARLCAILAPIMMFVEVIMDLQQPTLMSRIVDVGVVHRNVGYVTATGFVMVLCAAIGLISGVANASMASYSSVAMSGGMRENLFHKIQTLSYAEIDGFTTSSLITRLTNDVSQIQNMFLRLLRGMVKAPLTCVGGIAMSFLLSPRLALVFCIILPVILAFVVVVVRRSVPLYSQMQAWLDGVNVVMRESLLGVRVVKAFSMEARRRERFRTVNRSLTETSIQAQTLTFTLMPVVTLLMNVSVVAILWFGGAMVMSGDLETGRIMAFVNYMVQIAGSLVMLVNVIVNISRAQASATRVNEVMSCEPSIRDNGRNCRPQGYDIEFRKVSFRYASSSRDVLSGLSLRIKEGSTVAIVGATGSGKSTLVSLIPRLYDSQSGQVLIGGCDVRDIPLSVLRHDVGIVLQEDVLFEGTIEDNMKFGSQSAGTQDIEFALKSAQAWDFVERNPAGIEAGVEQRGKNFSGGQKQRLSIARTLIKHPKILILDDSSSALDFATEARLHERIRDRAASSTVIVIAQRISGVMDADEIIVLDHGGIVARGNHRQLLHDSPEYRAIAVSQLGEEVLSGVAA